MAFLAPWRNFICLALAVLSFGSFVNLNVASPASSHWFVTTELQPPQGCGYRLYRTREVHETPKNDGADANYYLLKGDSADLLIDTGFGLLSLRSHLQNLGLIGGGRPLIVLATHEHFDHAGGLHHFEDIEMNATIVMGWADADAVTQNKLNLNAANIVRTNYSRNPRMFWNSFPYPGFEASLLNYSVQSRVDRRVRFNDVISIGKKTSFQVLELPGHTPGSIALWNVNGTGEIYTGDALYDALLFDFCPDSDKSAYRATMELLRGLDISVAFPGHEEVLDRARYRQIIDCYLSGVNPCPPDVAPNTQHAASSASEDDPIPYILSCESEWAASCETGDISGMERFLADDFIGTVEHGLRYTKADALASRARTCQSNHFNGANITRTGDAIVVFGNETWVNLDGAHGMYVWTDTWAKKAKNAWQIVAANDFTLVASRGGHGSLVRSRVGLPLDGKPLVV